MALKFELAGNLQKNMIFLGIGTNLGDKGRNLTDALIRLHQAGVEVKRCSSVYETPPWGIEEQDSFYNMVIEVGYTDSPQALLEICLSTETEMGRERMVKWGPRLIDIDILEFHRKIILSDSLTLPHPYYTQRGFVLIPLAELEPNWRPTTLFRGIKEIIEVYDFNPLPRIGRIDL